MLPSRTRRPVAAAIIALTAIGLAGCASAQPEVSSQFTKEPGVSEQTVAEACTVSFDALNNISTTAQDNLAAAAGSLAAGEIPDLQPTAAALRDSLVSVQDAVSNPEVLAVVQGVGTKLEAFANLETPTSLLGAPGYIANIGGVVTEITSAVESIQTLCG